MPLKSKQSSRQTKSKPKTKARQRTPSPLNQSPESSGDDQEMEDESSDEEAPRLDMKSLLRALENQSKQKLAKKQNQTFQEMESVLQGVLVDRLNNLVKTQESELERMVSDYFAFKARIEEQKDGLINQIIQQQQSFQAVLKKLEDNMETYIKKVEGQSNSTIEQISQLDRQRKRKAHECLST